ncbi:hypothetical protein [Paenibacillus durus]|uniref:Uncharacterized protein n=1 Tax=Paenibacillus durus ATCC 35681 TaxID=1333534 RepID=A0A0F7FAL0_PAEDU|nr:hypothetical protein [Paenibacillus durus]AKG35642.1 hypothetical protein VK70_14540 [Paenibacillus durus ATCC 35681]
MAGFNGVLPLPEGLTSITVKTEPFPHFWRMECLDFIPVGTGDELRITKHDNGQYSVTGDHTVILLGQNVDPSTVDISGIRPDLDALGRLFNEALFSQTATDAARYLKLKAKLIG